jgi:hypothetical protein
MAKEESGLLRSRVSRESFYGANTLEVIPRTFVHLKWKRHYESFWDVLED